MGNDGFIKSLYIYQKERFPLAVLTFTTLSVVLSSVAVISKNHSPITNFLLESILAFIAGIIFMFNIRVLDERKDFNFDNKYHQERPIQRGVISIKSLFILDFILLLGLFAISIYSSIYSLIFLLISLIYSLVAGMDFFMGRKIRDRFLLYNILCLIQLFFFQIHLYSLMTPQINFKDSLLYIHFIFVITNAGIIEIARKLKVKKNESLGKDTYSSQLGKKKSSILYVSIILLSFLIFSYLLFQLSNSFLLFIIGIIALLIAVISILYYSFSENILSEKLVELCAIIYYLSLHILIYLTMVI